MHELSVCRALLRQVDAVMTAHGASAVGGVTLRIGPLAGVEPALLRAAFRAARRDATAQAELHIEAAPVRVHCEDCGHRAATDVAHLRCPRCASTATRLLAGDECLLVDVELLFAQDGG